MKSEQSPETERKSLAESIEENSEILLNHSQLNEELSKLAEAKKAMLGYYDSRTVKFSVDGYDFLYFDDELNLLHLKIRPGKVSGLESSGKVGEGDEIEEKLKELGFELDQSEKFRSALWRQLNA